MRVKTKSDEFAGMLSAKVRFEEVPSTAFFRKVDCANDVEVKKDAKETVACVNSSSACSFGTIVRTSYRNDRETAEKKHCSNVKQSDSGTTSERALGRRCNAVSRINGSTNKTEISNMS